MKHHHPLQIVRGPLPYAVPHINSKRALAILVAIILLALPEITFAIHRSFASDARNWTGGPFYGTHATFFADVTGDGMADAIAVNDDRIWFRRSDGCSFGPNEPLTSTPFFGTRATYFADVTGDGKADPIAVNNDRVTVRRSDDSRRSDWIVGSFSGELGIFFADVTGDGKADAIAVNRSGVTVRRSNGVNAFGPAEDWTMGPYYGTRGTFFADVTGGPDHRADAIVVNDDGVTVRRSRFSLLVNRDVFDLNETWTPDPYYGNRLNFFVDVTGDGRADAVVVNDDGIAVRDSLGNGFRSPDPVNHLVTAGDAVIRAWGYWTLDPFYGSRGTFFADVDGDHAADAIAVNDDGVWIRRSRFENFFSNCPA